MAIPQYVPSMYLTCTLIDTARTRWKRSGQGFQSITCKKGTDPWTPGLALKQRAAVRNHREPPLPAVHTYSQLRVYGTLSLNISPLCPPLEEIDPFPSNRLLELHHRILTNGATSSTESHFFVKDLGNTCILLATYNNLLPPPYHTIDAAT